MTDLGVVDPLRPPASVVAFGGRLRLLPPYAIGFLGVFIARAIADLYALLQPIGDLGGYPTFFSLVLGSVPDWLALLAPVAVGWAIVRSGEASARVTRGAIALGLSEVVAMGARFIGGPENPTFAISAAVRAVSFVLLAGGLLWLARGLDELRDGAASVLGRRGALLALAIGVLVAAIELIARLAQMVSFNYSDYAGGEDLAIFFASAVGVTYVLVPLAWAYLAAVLVRGGRDADGPAQGTRLGALAGWLRIAWLGASLASLAWLPFMGEADAPTPNLTMLSQILYVVAIAAAAMAFASIFALVAGLGSGLGSRVKRDTPAEPA